MACRLVALPLILGIGGCGGAGSSTAPDAVLLLPPANGDGMGTGPVRIARDDQRVLGVVEPAGEPRTFRLPLLPGQAVRVRPVCGAGVRPSSGGAVALRLNGTVRSVGCTGASDQALGPGRGDDVLSVPAFSAADAGALVVYVPMAPRVVRGTVDAGDHSPPTASHAGPSSREVVPESDPNAIVAVPVSITSGTRIEVTTNAAGSLMVLVDGRPLETGEPSAGRSSRTSLIVGTQSAVTSRGSFPPPGGIKEGPAVVTVVPQHFAVRGWRVSVR